MLTRAPRLTGWGRSARVRVRTGAPARRRRPARGPPDDPRRRQTSPRPPQDRPRGASRGVQSLAIRPQRRLTFLSGGQQSLSTRPGPGGVELSASAPNECRSQTAPGRPTARGDYARVESTGAAPQALQSFVVSEAPADRGGGGRLGTRGLSVGGDARGGAGAGSMTRVIVGRRAVPRLDVRALPTALCGPGRTSYRNPRA